MPLIDTSSLRQGDIHPQQLQVYNGLDCCITLEVLEELQALIGNDIPKRYDFSRALQGPFLEMALRGFKVNEYERGRAIDKLTSRIGELNVVLDDLVEAVSGQRLEMNKKGLTFTFVKSQKQLLDFFVRGMGLPEPWVSKKGVRKLSLDREQLEKYDAYLYARPIVATVLAIRDTAKQIETLSTALAPDGRWYTSFNIAGTNTGRISSSESSEGWGGNLQNLKRDDDLDENELSIRQVFEADEGFILVSIDREQSESREVGFILAKLFNDWSYLDACEGGDLHTLVCKGCWTALPWTNDAKKDRAIADGLAYRNNSYRDLAKKLGHGSNYYGKPFTMAKHAKVSRVMVEDFQRGYFNRFPGLPRWHRWTAQQLQVHGYLYNLFGERRDFLGRPNDDATLRKAIAHVPQSSTAYRTNLGLWRVWYEMGRDVQVLAQGHDSITFQMPVTCNHDETIRKALRLTEVELFHQGRRFVVPGDTKIGFNWGKYDEKLNPNGLRKWKGGQDERRRIATRDLLF